MIGTQSVRSAVCADLCTCLSSAVPLFVFFFNDTATTEIYTLSLHDALPILNSAAAAGPRPPHRAAHTVDPERETPRNTAATACANPIPPATPTQGSGRVPPGPPAGPLMYPPPREPPPPRTRRRAPPPLRRDHPPAPP